MLLTMQHLIFVLLFTSAQQARIKASRVAIAQQLAQRNALASEQARQQTGEVETPVVETPVVQTPVVEAPVCEENADNRRSVDLAIFKFDENGNLRILAKPIAAHMRLAKEGKTHMNAGGKFFRDCASLQGRSEDGQGQCDRLDAIWGAEMDEQGACQANNPENAETEKSFKGQNLERGEEAQLIYSLRRLTTDKDKYIKPVDSGYESWLDVLAHNTRTYPGNESDVLESTRVQLKWKASSEMTSMVYTYYADDYFVSILQEKTPKYDLSWLTCAEALSDRFVFAPLLRQLHALGKMPCPPPPACEENTDNRRSVDLAIFKYDENGQFQGVLAKPIAAHMRLAKEGKTFMNAGGKFFRDCPSLKGRSERGQGQCNRIGAIWGQSMDFETGACQANNPENAKAENTFKGQKLERGEEAQLIFALRRLTADRERYIKPVDSGYDSWLDLLADNEGSQRVQLKWTAESDIASNLYTFHVHPDDYFSSILQLEYPPKYNLSWLNCSEALSDRFVFAPLLRQLNDLGKMPCSSDQPPPLDVMEHYHAAKDKVKQFQHYIDTRGKDKVKQFQHYIAKNVASMGRALAEDAHCSVPSGEKKDCGYIGMQQQECETKGCCWQEASPGVPWCFHKQMV